MKFDAIYFDLDGTLWDTANTTLECLNKVCKKYNLPERTIEDVNNSMGKTKDECISIWFPTANYDDGLKYLLETLDENSASLALTGGTLYDGLEETLDELVRRNYKVGIVSNCLDGYIEAFMISSRLGKYFNDIVAAGKKDIKKSDAILLAIERDEVKSALYVGDTLKDKEAAEGAGLIFIQAKYGFGEDLNAKYSINQIRELPDLIKSIEENMG